MASLRPVRFPAYKQLPLYKLTFHVHFLLGKNWAAQISWKSHSSIFIFSLSLGYSRYFQLNMSSCWVINDFPKLVPPPVFSIFVTDATIHLFTQAWNLSYWFFYLHHLLSYHRFGSQSWIWLTLLPESLFPAHYNFFALVRPLILSCLHCYNTSLLFPTHLSSVRNFPLKCKFGHFILFFNFFSASNCQNSALLRRLTGLLSTSSNPFVFLPANTFTPARTCSLNTYHSCFLLFSSGYAFSSS